jgi:hypothetical protein
MEDNRRRTKLRKSLQLCISRKLKKIPPIHIPGSAIPRNIASRRLLSTCRFPRTQSVDIDQAAPCAAHATHPFATYVSFASSPRQIAPATRLLSRPGTTEVVPMWATPFAVPCAAEAVPLRPAPCVTDDAYCPMRRWGGPPSALPSNEIWRVLHVALCVGNTSDTGAVGSPCLRLLKGTYRAPFSLMSYMHAWR